MRLPIFIAWRYLFSKKSHGVINLISGISAAGMAIGTAALIVILSVYNGFDSIVRDSMGNVEPDILVVPAAGKVFIPEGEGFDWAYKEESILNMSTVLEENVYIQYADKSGIALARGVDFVYEEESPLRDKIVDGEFSFHKGDIPLAVAGSGLAYKMDINPHLLGGIDVYYPRRDAPFSASNPAASLLSTKVYPSGVFSVSSEIDDELLLVPIETLRKLLGYSGDEVSGVEIRMKEGTGARDLARTIRTLRTKLGPSFRVLDRYGQNETLYRMMKYEKAVVYLILIFVIIIIAFNIFGSLSMLIIEKEEDIDTLRSLGMKDSSIKEVFVLEGWLISLLGLGIGALVGILVTEAQSYFGIIQMPSGSFLTTAYPVVLQWKDVLLTVVSVAAVGYLIALLPVARLKKERLDCK